FGAPEAAIGESGGVGICYCTGVHCKFFFRCCTSFSITGAAIQRKQRNNNTGKNKVHNYSSWEIKHTFQGGEKIEFISFPTWLIII
ncbi:MAG TPA: hypothetical protein PKC69_09600, partial [Chitinophagaceae bacterium]|nr:hypothetical protein [Chitinophagaceae bacterium]